MQGLVGHVLASKTTFVAGFRRNNGQIDSKREEANIVHLLKACAKQKDLGRGFQIHAFIQKHKVLANNCYVASTLVSMYAKCGALAKAQQAFNDLPVRDVVTWNALLAGYVQQGQEEEALLCFDSMQHEGLSPNMVTFTCALKACRCTSKVARGEQIHDKIASLRMLEKDVVLGNALVDMYARCGALTEALQVSEELPVRDVVTWTSLIIGYAHQGQGEEALKCFDNMHHEGHCPDVVTFICVLRVCGGMGAVAKGEQIHKMIVSLSMLEKNIVLNNALVDMYARCGALAKAEQVLAELPVQDVVTWNVLIAGYVEQGQGDEALKCFDRMQREGHFPNSVTFTCALKACREAANGEQIHDKIVSLSMLERHPVLGMALVDMYVRCGALTKAQQTIIGLPLQDVNMWTALIAGYVQQGQGEEALKCFDTMEREGHYPNVATFSCALKACGYIEAVAKGEQFHEKIFSLGMLQKSILLQSVLIDMYIRCSTAAKAQAVFEELPVRDVETWNAMIAGYAHKGQGKEALKCFDNMQWEGCTPNVLTFASVLKACGSIGSAAMCEDIHEEIVSLGMLEKSSMVWNALLDMYIVCGALAKAKQVLEELPFRDVVTWSALIAGYAQQDQGGEALQCFDTMQCEGHRPDAVTFICALKACGSIGAIAKGEQIHEKIVYLHLLETNVVLGSALVEMYAKCGALGKAKQVLEELPIRYVVSWNALIVEYAQRGKADEVLICFDSMQCEGHSPDVATLSCALKACGSIRAAARGEQIHDKVVSLGMLEKNVVLGNTLVDMYTKCGALHRAQKVLEKLSVRDVAMWTALIAGYADHGQCKEALKCFDDMQCEGYSPTAVTFTCALKACASTGAVAKGEEIHEEIVHSGMLEKNIVLGNSLVDMYARCGALATAQQVLEELHIQDVVTWNALIAGYVQWGQGEEALKCFDRMQHEGHSPDAISFACVLHACAMIGTATKGEQIHDKIVNWGMLEKNALLGNSLVDMYAKCAMLGKALEVLKCLPLQDVVTWNVVIGGYAQQGQSAEAIACFEIMQCNGIEPDSITFFCILSACNHLGLVYQSEMIFLRMSIIHGITPDVDHYCCIVNLFSSVGMLSKALLMIEKMPYAEFFQVWVALLGGCRKWGDVRIAMFAFKHALYLDRTDDAVYLSMANIYASAGMHQNAEKIEIMRVRTREP